MNIEEQMEVFADILTVNNVLKVKGINESNHKPHQFMIGPKHIKKAEETNGGVLTEEILEDFRCGAPKCNLKYSQHESDKLLFLQLTRDATEIEANDELLKIKDKLLELKLKGVAFVDTEEKFKFLKNEPEGSGNIDQPETKDNL